MRLRVRDARRVIDNHRNYGIRACGNLRKTPALARIAPQTVTRDLMKRCWQILRQDWLFSWHIRGRRALRERCDQQHSKRPNIRCCADFTSREFWRVELADFRR